MKKNYYTLEDLTEDDLQVIMNAFCAMRSKMVGLDDLFDMCYEEHKTYEQLCKVQKLYDKIRMGIDELKGN